MQSTLILRVVCCAFVLSITVAAQQGTSVAPECPRKFWDYDIQTFGYEPAIATLDDLALQVQQGRIPKVFIVACVYGAWPGRPYRHVAMVKNYLLGSRGLPPERVREIYVMGCATSSIEIWTGETPPDLPKAETVGARYLRFPALFDEYYNAFTGENSWVGEEDEPARLNAFADFLTRNPDTVGYLVGFAGTPARGYVGERLTGTQFAARERAWLERNRGISRNRLRVLDGGRRILAGIQLWIAQKNTPLTSKTIRSHRPQWD
jgi:hypothetical protein